MSAVQHVQPSGSSNYGRKRIAILYYNPFLMYLLVFRLKPAAEIGITAGDNAS